MDLRAAFERAIEGMEWEELVSTLHAALNDMLDSKPTPPSPAPSSLPPPPPPVPAGPELNTRPQPALSEDGEAVCHLMAAPTMPQGVYSHGQCDNKPVVRLPDGINLHPIGMLNGEVLHVVTAETFAPPVSAAPPVNTSRSKKRKRESQQKEDRLYIKKPLNAFMLFMKEQRANTEAEIMKRSSTMVNAVLGQRWNSLTREEQAKYYDQAEKERLLHAQRHPGWSTGENYGKKKKRERKMVRNQYKVFTCKREEKTGVMKAPHTQTSVMEAPLVAQTGVMKALHTQTAVMEPCALQSVKVQKPHSETPVMVPVCGMYHLPQGYESSPASWMDAAPSTSRAALALPPLTAPNQWTSENFSMC